MNFWTTENISLISLVISAFALLVALRSSRESRRASLAANHQKYVELLTSTKLSLASGLREFRQEASRIYPELLHLLDKFPCRSERYLRHVAGRFCHLRTAAFANQIQIKQEYRLNRFPGNLWEVEMDEPETFEIKEVLEMVPTHARAQLYHDILRVLGPYWESFDNLQPKLEAALVDLDGAMEKSKLEEYPLKLSPKIYRNYEATLKTYRLLLDYDIYQARPTASRNHVAEGYEVSTLFYAVSVLMLVEESWMWEDPKRTRFSRFFGIFTGER